MDLFSSAIQNLRPALDDDLIDRFNHYYTPNVFLLFALVIITRQWIGHPIQCWVPAEFKRAWEEYTENYCFAQNTYWLSMNSSIPEHMFERNEKRICYYQWVPFILATQALMFCIPHLVWRLLSFCSGYNIDTVISVSGEVMFENPSVPDESKLLVLSAFLKDLIRVKKTSKIIRLEEQRFNYPADRGLYLTVIYILCKLLYFLNTVGQLLLFSTVLATGDGAKQHNMFIRLFEGVNWRYSGIFPVVTLCDFDVRMLGQINRFTVQCVLMINAFNEKIFAFLWIWVALLSALNAYHLMYWITYAVCRDLRAAYVARLLNPKAPSDSFRCEDEQTDEHRMITKFLRADGFLIVRKVASHSGKVVAAKLLRNLLKEVEAESQAVIHLPRTRTVSTSTITRTTFV